MIVISLVSLLSHSRPAAVDFANATTTIIIASISMAYSSTRSFQQERQQKEARSKEQRREDGALRTVIDALGVPAEGDLDRYRLQDSTNVSSDESNEVECEITDGEVTNIFGVSGILRTGYTPLRVSGRRSQRR